MEDKLLPSTTAEFSSEKYWQNFFKRRSGKIFEWYGEYSQLCGILHKYIKPNDAILMVGCGNSDLSSNLYDVGLKNITNIDINDLVCKNMSTKNLKRNKMKFLTMDVTQMSFDDSSFNVVLDKGTLDALFNTDNETSKIVAHKMFNEIKRVLKLGGRYICITLAQEYILNNIVAYFNEINWLIRICHVEMVEESSFKLPLFAIVLTKFLFKEGIKGILEFSSVSHNIQRYNKVVDLIAQVKQLQYYAFLIDESHNSKNFSEDNQFCIKLHNETIEEPRYLMHLVINKAFQFGSQYGIFIVPEGRESEWMFSSFEGRNILALNANCKRLLVVTLSRSHKYGDLNNIKTELSKKVMDLAPPKVSETDVCFMTLGDDTSCRTIKESFESEKSGIIFVEDVKCNEVFFRRIIFESSPNIIQSEAKLLTKVKKKKRKFVIDNETLTCSHHHYMVAGLIFVENIIKIYDESNLHDLNLLLIGFGGGLLTLFLHNFFEKLKVEAVEIDEILVTIAHKWFQFPHNDCSVIIKDGIQYIEDLLHMGKRFLMIMLDVNSKDATNGMGCPPDSFVTTMFIEKLFNLIENNGLLVLNLVCRNKTLKLQVIEKLKLIFQTVLIVKIYQEVNEIVYCLKRKIVVCANDFYNDGLTILKHIIVKPSVFEKLSLNDIKNIQSLS